MRCFFLLSFCSSFKMEYSTLFQLKMAHGQWLIIYVFIIRQSIVIKNNLFKLIPKQKRHSDGGWGCGLRNSGISVQCAFFLKQITADFIENMRSTNSSIYMRFTALFKYPFENVLKVWKWSKYVENFYGNTIFGRFVGSQRRTSVYQNINTNETVFWNEKILTLPNQDGFFVQFIFLFHFWKLKHFWLELVFAVSPKAKIKLNRIESSMVDIHLCALIILIASELSGAILIIAKL